MKRAARRAVSAAVFTVAALGCRAPEERRADLGLAVSFLPNLGLAGSASAALRTTQTWEWRAEARFSDQFLDDKTFADNGLPEAGDWTQLELGLRARRASEEGRHWVVRFGALGFEARGETNLVDEAGDYLGLYLGAGLETDIGRGFSIGPEFNLIAASGPDEFALVPQITWGLRWCPARTEKGP